MSTDVRRVEEVTSFLIYQITNKNKNAQFGKQNNNKYFTLIILRIVFFPE